MSDTEISEFKQFYQTCWRNIKDVAKRKNFYLKVFGMVLNMTVYQLWRQWEGSCGMMGAGQMMLFLCTVPPSNVIFTAEMIVMLLGERAGMWFHRVYNSVGGILYGTVGVVALFNRVNHVSLGNAPLFIGPVCFIQSFVLIVDMLMNESYVMKKRMGPPVPVMDEDVVYEDD